MLSEEIQDYRIHCERKYSLSYCGSACLGDWFQTVSPGGQDTKELSGQGRKKQLKTHQGFSSLSSELG